MRELRLFDSTGCLDLPKAYEADKPMVSLGTKTDIFLCNPWITPLLRSGLYYF